MEQSTSKIMMIRPKNFCFNEEAAQSNSFQNRLNLSHQEVQEKVLSEFDQFVQQLTNSGVNVNVVEDTAQPIKPDAIFPNNWISMSHDGKVTLFPMCNPNRRIEKRGDIVNELKLNHQVQEVIDLSRWEEKGKFLEGTGSIVYDHVHQKAYASISERTDQDVFVEYCKQTGYEPVIFEANDSNGQPIYHTNVVMGIGTGYVVINLECIPKEYHQKLQEGFKEDSMEVIAISNAQMEKFGGNVLEVRNESGELFLVVSETAIKVMNEDQIRSIKKHADIISVSIPVIETIGGGSVRCMLAENFLS